MKIYILRTFEPDSRVVGSFTNAEVAHRIKSILGEHSFVEESEVDEMAEYEHGQVYYCSIDRMTADERHHTAWVPYPRHPTKTEDRSTPRAFCIGSPTSDEEASTIARKARVEWLKTDEAKQLKVNKQ